jgi:hypothetical protein
VFVFRETNGSGMLRLAEERERENGVGCGMLGQTEESIMREKKKKFEGFTVDRESNEVKGELSWLCAIYMTRTHVNF